jgi:predicted AlkP superfamily pyrophosphatase or phosphodiesterase
MIFPDYKGKSIVNLMSSIMHQFNLKNPYSKLNVHDKYPFKKKILLIVIDGLGYNYIKNNLKGTFLYENLKCPLTSVFPSTTASSIMTFLTGVAPLQHASTGWYMFTKETGSITAVLPFKPKFSMDSYNKDGYFREDIITVPFISDYLKKDYCIISPNDIISHDKKNSLKGSKNYFLGYKSLEGFYLQNIKSFKLIKRKGLIYSYWPFFDKYAHSFGVSSKQAKLHVIGLDLMLRKIANKLPLDTSLIITSDHGFIDTKKEKVIWLDNHPNLRNCLSIPLCGELRNPYCYIRLDKEKEFLNYIKNNLSHVCTPVKSIELVKKGVFGLFKMHPMFMHRVGDYNLIVKDNYIFRDVLPKAEKKYFIGNHGGTHEDEILVPLIIK